MKEKLLSRFVRYAKINTISKHDETRSPTTLVQFDLAKLLVKELQDMGVVDVSFDEHCYVIGKLPSNIPKSHPKFNKIPAIGFLAHLDTAPDLTGENVNPQIIKDYKGGDITIKDDVMISRKDNPQLDKCLGHTIVTTDGNTLLGADDKAGIAAIVTAIECIKDDKNFLHGDIYFCFNPDEEVGMGTASFPRDRFPVEFAYTIDGGSEGVLNKETFNADNAKIIIHGVDIHPGTAKDVMVNANRVASRIIDLLPIEISPERTCDHEGFIHPTEMTSSTGSAQIRLILRDFTEKGLGQKRQLLEEIVQKVRKENPKAVIDLEIKKSYRNMLTKLEENPRVLELLEKAVKEARVDYKWEPIRGGTDGAELTRLGIPTPNIFTGGHNFHGRMEWLSVDVLNKTTEIILNIVKVD